MISAADALSPFARYRALMWRLYRLSRRSAYWARHADRFWALVNRVPAKEPAR